MSSVKTLEEAKVSKGCLYMGMPVQEVRRLVYCTIITTLITRMGSMARCNLEGSRKFKRKVIK